MERFLPAQSTQCLEQNRLSCRRRHFFQPSLAALCSQAFLNRSNTVNVSETSIFFNNIHTQIRVNIMATNSNTIPESWSTCSAHHGKCWFHGLWAQKLKEVSATAHVHTTKLTGIDRPKVMTLEPRGRGGGGFCSYTVQTGGGYANLNG